jgi:hypothetical protein
MAQERNRHHCRDGQCEDEHETAQDVAVRSLKNELALGVRLLRQVKESRETLAIEAHVIDSARNAYRHATEALDRIAQLEPADMQIVHRLMDEFRSALADLGD